MSESHAKIMADPALGAVLVGTKMRFRLVPQGRPPDTLFWEQKSPVKWFWATDPGAGQPGGPRHEIEQDTFPFNNDTKHTEHTFDKPGIYKIVARYLVRNAIKDLDEFIEVVEHSVWVRDAEAVLDQAVANQIRTGLVHPATALSAMRRHTALLMKLMDPKNLAAGKKLITIKDPDVSRRTRYCDKLEILLQSTRSPRLDPVLDNPFGDGRMPIGAAWVDKTNPGTSKPLNVFVMMESRPDGGIACRLVHWTDPLAPAMNSEHLGRGITHDAAFRDAVDHWSRFNRLPPGHIEVKPTGTIGATAKKVFATPGTEQTAVQTLAEVADSAAFALGVVSTIALLVVPVPGSQVLAGLMWTLTFTNAAVGASAAALKIAQRHEEGMGNWHQDALDTLNIVANLVPCAGTWARGAKVVGMTGQQAIFYGEMIGAGVQGVVIARDLAADWDKILADNTEGNNKVLMLLTATAKAAAQGAIVYVGARAASRDMAKLKAEMKPTPGSPTRPNMQQSIEDWLNEQKQINVEPKKSVALGGRTGDGEHKTVVEEDHRPPLPGKSAPPAPTPGRPTPGKPIKLPAAKPPPERGMRHVDDFDFTETAKREKLWVVVRDSSPAATKHIGFGKTAKLARGKPESLKAKTLREGPNAGLVAANPNDKRMVELLAAEKPTMSAEALLANPAEKAKRYQAYVKELEGQGFHVDGPENDFLVFKTDPKDGKVFFHSDYDLHGVYSAETGQPVSSEKIRGQFNKDAEKDMVLHGAHDEWDKRNSVTAGPNGGPQPPATAYGPNGEKFFIESREQFKAFYEAEMPGKQPFPWPYNWPAPLN